MMAKRVGSARGYEGTDMGLAIVPHGSRITGA
jgi:hypothetical protein